MRAPHRAKRLIQVSALKQIKNQQLPSKYITFYANSKVRQVVRLIIMGQKEKKNEHLLKTQFNRSSNAVRPQAMLSLILCYRFIDFMCHRKKRKLNQIETSI